MYIAFEGPIGAGKTTLAKALANRLSATLILEKFEENPFLADFYASKDRWALPMQLWFLYERHKQLRALDPASRPIVADHTFIKNRVFAQTLLRGRELDLYERISSELSIAIRMPDVIVLLDATDNTLLTRIRSRGRDYEAYIDSTYITTLRASYDSEFRLLPATLIQMDTTDLDPRSDETIARLHSNIFEAIQRHKKPALSIPS